MPQVPICIAIGNGKNLTIWNIEADYDVATKHHELKLPGNIVGTAWNHNGQAVAACYDAQTRTSTTSTSTSTANCISLISARSGEIMNDFGDDKLQGCQSLNFAGKSRLLCCTCTAKTIINTNTRAKTSGDHVSIWDLKRMVEARRFESSNTSPLISSSLDASDTYVFALTRSSFSVYLLKENVRVGKIDCDNNAVPFSCYDTTTTPEQQCLIALGDESGTVKIYDLKDILLKNDKNDDDNSRFRPLCKFRFDGRLNISRKATTRTQSTTGNDLSKCVQIAFSDVMLGLLMSDRLVIYNWLNQVIVGDIRLSTINDGGTPVSCFAWNGSTAAFAFSSSREVSLIDWKTGQKLAGYELALDDENLETGSQLIQCLAFSPINIERLSVNSVQQRTLKQLAANTVEETGSTDIQSLRSSPPQSSAASNMSNLVLDAPSLHAPASIVIESVLDDTNAYNHKVQSTQSNDEHEYLEQPKNDSDTATCTDSVPISRNFTEVNEVLTDQTFSYNEFEEEKKQNDFPTDMKSSEERLVNLFREDIKEAINSLHSDMIRQFQIQSEEVNKSLSKQLDVMERMADENHRLRLENRRLRDFLRQNEGSM